MKKIKLVSLLLLSFSGSLLATNFNLVEPMNFSVFMSTNGECSLDSATGNVTELSGNGFCAYAEGASPATFKFTGIPNEDYEFKVNLLAASNSNGYMFTPEGSITSDLESKVALVGSFVRVNAGTTGIINIRVGGRLRVDSSTNLQAGTKYRVREVFSISWQEAP